MNIRNIITTGATTLLLLGTPAFADHHEKAKGADLTYPVTVSDAKGATLWDFHGNKIGEIENILLSPGEAGALVVVDTTILEEDRKIVVPWKVIQVQTKKDDADDIVYALDADKSKLMAAPQYDGNPMSLRGEVKACCTYWDKDLKSTVKHSAKEISREIKEAGREIKDSVN